MPSKEISIRTMAKRGGSVKMEYIEARRMCRFEHLDGQSRQLSWLIALDGGETML